MTTTEKLNLTLRSLFRYTMMMENKYPNLLVEMESQILDNRIASLSEEEILFIENNFSNMYKEYIQASEVEDACFAVRINKSISKIN